MCVTSRASEPVTFYWQGSHFNGHLERRGRRRYLLQPDIAASAGLMRGPTHGVLNVAVQRPDGSAVDAVLKGEVRSLIGQPVALDFKRIQEGDAIYFVANYTSTQRGILLFKVDIQAEEGAMVHSLSFQQEFFPDDQ